MRDERCSSQRARVCIRTRAVIHPKTSKVFWKENIRMQSVGRYGRVWPPAKAFERIVFDVKCL